MNREIDTTNFDHQLREINCPRCKSTFKYYTGITDQKTHENYKVFIQNVNNLQLTLAEEIIAFFPDTPIRDFIKTRQDDLIDAVIILSKLHDLTEAERINYRSNYYLKDILK